MDIHGNIWITDVGAHQVVAHCIHDSFHSRPVPVHLLHVAFQPLSVPSLLIMSLYRVFKWEPVQIYCNGFPDCPYIHLHIKDMISNIYSVYAIS